MKNFLWLLLVGVAYAQILIPATNSGSGCSATSGGTTCTTPNSFSFQPNDTVIAMVSSNNAAVNPVLGGTCTGITWPSYTKTSSTANVLVFWIVPHISGSGSACNISVTSGLSGSSNFLAQIYRNVASVGTPNAPTTQVASTVNLVAPTITTTNAGSWILGLIASASSSAGSPFTGVGGTVVRRTQSGGSGITAILMDQAATSVGQQVAPQATASSSMAHMRAAIELVPAPTNHVAQLSEAMQTVLMNSPKDNSYELPSSGLSPTWCTWFMPINTGHSYDVAPQSTQLNGQTNDMHVPAWQMTRICQDTQGHFWASPPLLAGTGISITPAPTGVTISSTGGGGGGAGDMKYIAGDTAHLPGGVALAANACALLDTSTATGVLTSDVVSYTLVGVASATWVHVVFRPTISSNDQVAWNGCNVSSSSVTPAARDVHWYVARHVVAPVAHHKPAKRVARPKR